MLRVFPITLKGRALRWKKRLPAGVINTWDLLEKEFIWQYCSSFKTAKKLEEICNFKQEMDETLYHAWERYSDLLYRCPQHDLNCQQKVIWKLEGGAVGPCNVTTDPPYVGSVRVFGGSVSGAGTTFVILWSYPHNL
ncbi:ribonuclease H-like domain-containing protein [Tanacetum coccineum]